jgi:uncharacterized protein (DUF2126 family)
MKNVWNQWQTGPWFLRAERCYLFPGDSAMGYRLPIDSQPWTAQSDYPYVNVPGCRNGDRSAGQLRRAARPGQRRTRSPWAADAGSAQLRRRFRGAMARAARAWDKPTDTRPGFKESAGWITRLAMCAEPRDGKLYIFMPPTEKLDDYLEIVAAVERPQKRWPAGDHGRLRAAVRPAPDAFPRDPRSGRHRSQYPPGEELGPAGRADHAPLRCGPHSRLTTEKFMVDGRHTGTGGGNHFVLGGATPNDSPFLRRPDLLKSLIAYWHNHPSLSYLFSGLFIGPTSQAPRIDEARNDSLYELEIAFKPDSAGRRNVPPWLIDRILRNLLTDVTGNTHRAEFCIDKLYSPDGPTGRLGLLELRAFEMPPHARMSLAQQLLLRAMIARFWEEPYQPQRLARWGTELHDRFMLPHFVEQDFRDVMEEMTAAGYPFKPNGLPRISNSASRNTAISPSRAWSSNCAMRSNPGTSWARRARPVARCATSIRRSSASRSRSPAWRRTATS